MVEQQHHHRQAYGERMGDEQKKKAEAERMREGRHLLDRTKGHALMGEDSLPRDS